MLVERDQFGSFLMGDQGGLAIGSVEVRSRPLAHDSMVPMPLIRIELLLPSRALIQGLLSPPSYHARFPPGG